MELLAKIEELKQKGTYGLQVYYGEGIGCDDLDIPIMDRKFRLVFTPVGYLGSMRAMYEGNVKEFLEFDFTQEPKIISNPPKQEEFVDHGFYCWGSDSSMNVYNETKKLFPY